MLRVIAIMTLAALICCGCTSSMKPGTLNRVQPHSDNHRAGNAYLLRGWIGIFSAGIDNLTAQINQSGVRASVFQDDQWAALARRIKKEYRGQSEAEPLILIGHSYGADDVVRIARELQEANITVDLLVTLDPVTPPPVPANVRRCVNIYQSNGVWDTVPVLRGVPVKLDARASGELENLNIRAERKDLLEPGTDHFNIEKKQKIHNEIIRQVLASCPAKPQFSAAANPDDTAVPARSTLAPAHSLAAQDSGARRPGD